MIEAQLISFGLLFLFATLGGLVAARFKQPVILGLLVVGMIIGPNMLNLMNDGEAIATMTEMGTILFLFVIGLEFSVKGLLDIGMKAVVVTLFKVGVMFVLGVAASLLLGLGITLAVFIGFIISFSSTMISINMLRHRGLDKRPEIPLLLAVLILEDIMGVLTITFFEAVRKTGSGGIAMAMGKLFVSIIILIAAYIVFTKIAERIVMWLTASAGDDSIPFIGLGLCAGFSYLAFVLGVGPSVGAFLAGSIVSTFKSSKHFEHAVTPYTTMFTSFFFLAIGTMINLTAVKENLLLTLVITLVMVVGMFLSVGVVTRMFANYSKKGAFFSTIAMMPMGVFSVLIAQEAMHFQSAIDLVSITSVVMLLLALIMTFAMSKHEQLYTLFVSEEPSRFSIAVSRFSGYLTSFFEELVVETTYTKKLKSKVFALTLQFTGLLLIIISVAYIFPMTVGWQSWSLLGLAAVFVVLLIASIRTTAHAASALLIKILAGLEGETHVAKTKIIVKNMGLGTAILLVGLYSPLLLFLFELPVIYLTASLAIIVWGLLHLGRAISYLHNFAPELKYTVKSYKKFTAQDFSFNKSIVREEGSWKKQSIWAPAAAKPANRTPAFFGTPSPSLKAAVAPSRAAPSRITNVPTVRVQASFKPGNSYTGTLRTQNDSFSRLK